MIHIPEIKDVAIRVGNNLYDDKSGICVEHRQMVFTIDEKDWFPKHFCMIGLEDSEKLYPAICVVNNNDEKMYIVISKAEIISESEITSKVLM